MAKRKWFLDTPLITEQLMIAQAHASLLALATNAALPAKLRDECAHLALRLGRLARDLPVEPVALKTL